MAVDTKFIERHEGLLRNLLDFLLPEAAKTGVNRFEERFGLRYDEALVRCRLLDSQLKTRLSLPVDDLAVPLSQFRALAWVELFVIITENKMTFLTLPAMPNALGIWGGGDAAELLASVSWLTRCHLYFWGDVDVHGFHILSSLRRTFPSVVSVMMNETTLDRFSRLTVPARPPSYEDVSGLTESERQTYQHICAKRLLLEQEKIPHAYAVQQLHEALHQRTGS